LEPRLGDEKEPLTFGAMRYANMSGTMLTASCAWLLLEDSGRWEVLNLGAYSADGTRVRTLGERKIALEKMRHADLSHRGYRRNEWAVGREGGCVPLVGEN
jgi:hypothetical protein